MTLSLEERLNQILPRVTSRDFLESKGLGNEIGFWIFDYPPERELDVRDFVSGTVLPALGKQTPPLRTAAVNLVRWMVSMGLATISAPSLTARPMVFDPRSSPSRRPPRGSDAFSSIRLISGIGGTFDTGPGHRLVVSGGQSLGGPVVAERSQQPAGAQSDFQRGGVQGRGADHGGRHAARSESLIHCANCAIDHHP